MINKNNFGKTCLYAGIIPVNAATNTESIKNEIWDLSFQIQNSSYEDKL